MACPVSSFGDVPVVEMQEAVWCQVKGQRRARNMRALNRTVSTDKIARMLERDCGILRGRA